MLLLVLKNGEVVNTVLVPEGWPYIEDAWQPPEGCTAEPDIGQDYPRISRTLSEERQLEALQVKALEDMMLYLSTQGDTPQSVKDLAANILSRRQRG